MDRLRRGIREEKRPLLAIEAVSADPSFRLLVAGDGPLTRRVRRARRPNRPRPRAFPWTSWRSPSGLSGDRCLADHQSDRRCPGGGDRGRPQWLARAWQLMSAARPSLSTTPEPAFWWTHADLSDLVESLRRASDHRDELGPLRSRLAAAGSPREWSWRSGSPSYLLSDVGPGWGWSPDSRVRPESGGSAAGHPHALGPGYSLWISRSIRRGMARTLRPSKSAFRFSTRTGPPCR